MKNGWPMVSLGEVMRESRDAHAIKRDQQYPNFGIYSFGRGVFAKPPIDGMATSAATLYRACAGQFVYSRLFAFEGAYGVVPKELDGYYVSNEFPLFDCDPQRLLPEYLRRYLSIRRVWEDVATASIGVGHRRQRVQPEGLLKFAVPLPPIEEQRRIVARIRALAAKIEAAQQSRTDALTALGALIESARRSAFPSGDGSTVGDFAKLQSGYAFKSEWFSDDGIRLVRNANIGHGAIEWGQVARIPMARRSEFAGFELAAGDILITLDRPIISTGTKVARVRSVDLPSLLLQRVARVQFTSPDVEPDYLFAWLQSPLFANAIDPGRSNGVPHISPKDVERAPFCAPSVREQRRIVAYLNGVSAKAESLKSLQQQSAAELEALLPSVLDQAFAGKL